MINSDDYKKVSINRALLLTLLALTFALGVFAGSGMDTLTSPLPGKIEAVPDSAEGTFRFIRTSTMATGSGKNYLTRELKPFQYKVNALIENSFKKGYTTDVSVYFRDLNNGNWFGIREHDKFSPKSVLKVPLMIAYFKWAELNPFVLRKTLTYAGTDGGSGRDLKGLEPGKAYSINDLIFRMISRDDADAYTLLYKNLPTNRLEKIFKDLYVEYDPEKRDDVLSLNAFASFFRVLFNASYLSEEMSEKALRFLSRSTFRDGMAAGIPTNIDIACKHGERTISIPADGESRVRLQMHEFGIIYCPNRPYLLGIMARGNDGDHLKQTIRDITHLVYDEVNQQS